MTTLNKAKKYFSAGLFFTAAIYAPFCVSAQTDEGWVINNFHSDITIRVDGKVNIEEIISLDFYNLERHGIYRDIPYIYQSDNGQKIYTEIEVNGIAINNTAVPYEVSRNSSFIRIKIGDANKTISGKQTYKINYLATGILRSFAEYDELYWNVTGLQWPVVIEKSSAAVTIPSNEIIQAACYTGGLGSALACSNKEIVGKTAVFKNNSALPPGQGLTVAMGFTKGTVPILYIEKPKAVLDIILLPKTLISFFAILILGLASLLMLWWKFGRDLFWERKSLHDSNQTAKILPIGEHETIGAEYEPPEGLRPAEIGVLIDERADTIDVSATIVDLATRGYLTITEVPKKWALGKVDYTLTKQNKDTASLLGYEKMLLDSLFDEGQEVKISSLKNSFYKDLKKVKSELYKEVIRKNFFVRNPESVRIEYLLFAILTIGAAGFLAIAGSVKLIGVLLGGGLGLILCGIVFLIISFFMPKRTAFGRETYRKARGYSLFVSGTEKYRQPFFENENTFMQVLPYAIVFGVTKKLANAMKEMGVNPPQPSWYVGAHAFNAFVFASDVESFSKSLSTAIASAPGGSGSGGGGFSGGGFGGGGGGSW